MSPAANQDSPLDLSLPRILCLHGGGVTAPIFRAQARALIRALPAFRLVFADAPYPSRPGPGILPVYASWGPFLRWLRWEPEHEPLDDEAISAAILHSIETCKRRDEGTGAWVGILGFSQGAKVAASVLYRQQLQMQMHPRDKPNPNPSEDDNYRFGVIMAGRGPLVFLSTDPEAQCPPGLASAGAISTASANEPLPSRDPGPGPGPEVLLRVPTIHVHGLADEGLSWHRDFMTRWHDPGTVTLVEWEGGHRVPVKMETVGRVAGEIYRVAREVGVDV